MVFILYYVRQVPMHKKGELFIFTWLKCLTIMDMFQHHTDVTMYVILPLHIPLPSPSTCLKLKVIYGMLCLSTCYINA